MASHRQQSERNPRLKLHHDTMAVEEDRISSLPDEIIHHIFSFLDMGTIARTAFLAKRWRYLFLQTPILNFIMDPWMGYAGYPYTSNLYITNFNNFLSLIDKVLLLEEPSRRNVVVIKKLDIKLDDYEGSFDSSRVISWVVSALTRNVNHIHLKFPVSQPVELPHQMFTAPSNVETLKVSSSLFRANARVRMPSSLCTSPRIKRLHLYEVLFPDGDMNGELVLACPLLVDMELDSCDISNLNVLTISTPILETLKLINVFTYGETSCMVKTCTPNLQKLNIQADEESSRNYVVEYFMEDLSSVVEANINVDIYHENDVRKKRWSASLIGILSKAHNLQSLEIGFTSLQILTNISELLQKLPNLYPNLKYVMLDDPCKAPFHILLTIMRGVPCIESLAWWTCSFSEDLTANLYPTVSIMVKSLHDMRWKEVNWGVNDGGPLPGKDGFRIQDYLFNDFTQRVCVFLPWLLIRNRFLRTTDRYKRCDFKVHGEGLRVYVIRSVSSSRQRR